jgi:hypothetical protein
MLYLRGAVQPAVHGCDGTELHHLDAAREQPGLDDVARRLAVSPPPTHVSALLLPQFGSSVERMERFRGASVGCGGGSGRTGCMPRCGRCLG